MLPSPNEPRPAASVADLYRHIWRHAEGARLRMALALSMLLGSQLLKLAVPWAAAQAINAIQVAGTKGMKSAAAWIGAIVGLHVAAWALHGPGRVLERGVGIKVRRGISDELYAKLARAPIAWHDKHHSGDIRHRVELASKALYDFAQTQFIYLQSFANIVGPVVALILLSVYTGMSALLGYMVVGFLIMHYDGMLMLLTSRQNQAERRYGTRLLDFLGNFSTLASLGLQTASRSLLDKRLSEVFEPMKRSMVLNEVKWCIVDLSTVVLTWGLVVMYAWQTGSVAGTVALGSLFMIYQYAQQAGSVIGSLASNYQNFVNIRTNFASADAIWEAPEIQRGGPAVAADWDSIRLHDIGFVREGAQDSGRGGLHGIDLELRRGERLALVGPSGAGKSTLLRVLAGLYDIQHGRYEVDGVAQINLRHLGSIATLIPQESEIFEASVRENINFDQVCLPLDLQRALHASAFDTVLETLPQGLDTGMVERGFNLSGGQRQRLALARGVLAARASSLLLLDEPTSALDPVTEAQVHTRFALTFPGACIVASVHRMSLLSHFDRVAFMLAGRVVDVGTVPELMRRQPIFAEMVRGSTADYGRRAGDLDVGGNAVPDIVAA